MSLTVFHIVFVFASVAMSALVGGWGIRNYLQTNNTTHLAVGAATLLLGALLLPYSIWFVRKMRKLNKP